jgi:hypothetical protein
MKNLSSHLTYFYKVWGLLWLIGTIISVILITYGTHSLWGLFFLIMIIPFVRLVNIYQIKYDSKNVNIKKWTKTETIDFTKIKSMNEGDLLSLDPFFELEIISDRGDIEKINFQPSTFESLHYIFTKKLIGQLLDFKNQIRNLKE